MFDEKTGILVDNDCVSKQDKQHDKQVFYSAMKEYGFDFTDIDERTKLPKSLIPVVAQKIEPFTMFNHAILELHKRKVIAITDAITYLIEDYFDAKDIVKLLQTVTLNYIQNDLKAKYGLDKQQKANKFLDFIY